MHTKNKYTGFLTAREALEYLGLWTPGSGKEPNQRFLKYLYDRGELPRTYLSKRKIRYEVRHLDALLRRAKYQKISLTAKPEKKAA